MDIPSYLLGKKAGGSGGTSDYNNLNNKPSINGVTLSGNKTTSDLGIDLTNYVTNTDYASRDSGGVIKTGYGLLTNNNGETYANVLSYENYQTSQINNFISKGTLENVLNAKIGNINTILATLTTPSGNGGN